MPNWDTWQMRDPDAPNSAHRSEYPDRLWLTDYNEPPPADTGLYAISNAHGTLPPFWIYRNVTVPKIPAPTGPATGPGQESPDEGGLEKRLPTYIEMYGGNWCSNYRVQIWAPRSWQCYGAWTATTIISVYIPSWTYGDIYNVYWDHDCTDYQQQLFQFSGCFTSQYFFWSIFPCNVCS
jgi:hypothetical protein